MCFRTLRSESLGTSNALHDYYARSVQLVNHVFRWNTDGTNKQLRATFDDDIGEFWQLSLCVVILQNAFKHEEFLKLA